VRNWSSLTREALSGLIEHFAELRESDDWKKNVTGGVYSVEAVFNPKQKEGLRWHPHLHVLFETSDRIPQSWIHGLRVLWQRISGGCFLHLQPVYSRAKNGRKTRRIDLRALRELVKYATKAADFSTSPEHVAEFFRAFKSVRRVQTFGTFLGKCDAQDSAEDDEKNKSDELVGCKCGQCRWKDGFPSGLFRERETFLNAQGVRQLRLFEFDVGSPEKSPEPEPEEPVVLAGQFDLFFSQNEFRF